MINVNIVGLLYKDACDFHFPVILWDCLICNEESFNCIELDGSCALWQSACREIEFEL